MTYTTPIILVRQKHLAERAGEHYDLRVVIGDKAYSWATKKEMPELGKPTIIFEQPVHDRKYALSKKVVIPKGQYGAGVTTLDFAQKGKAKIVEGEYHLDLNNKERFFLKRLNPERYGENAWLFARKRTYEEKDVLLKALEEKRRLRKNPYLEKAAARKGKKESSTYTPTGRAATIAGTAVLPGVLARSATDKLSDKSLRTLTPDITEEDVQSYRRAKNLRHVTRNHLPPDSISSYTPAFKGSLPEIHSASTSSALHEYGHAHSFNKTRSFNIPKLVLQAVSRKAMLSKYTGAAGAYAGTSENEKIRNAAPYAAAAAMAPILYEEGAATLSPYKHLRKTRGAAVANQFLKKMAPSYGTYIAMVGSVIAPPILAKKITERRIEERKLSK